MNDSGPERETLEKFQVAVYLAAIALGLLVGWVGGESVRLLVLGLTARNGLVFVLSSCQTLARGIENAATIMSNDQEPTDEEVGQQLAAFVMQEIKAGSDKPTITARLEEMGVEAEAARDLVSNLYDGIMDAARSEAFTATTLPLAIFGGVMTALIGGAIWGAIVIFSGYELGMVAWGIGALAGIAVVMASQGKKGPPLQLIAVASSVAGIVFGKYLAFAHFLKEYVEEEYGAEAAAEVSTFSADVIRLFFESAQDLASGFDLLWMALAVVTAWQIPKSMGIKASSGLPQ